MAGPYEDLLKDSSESFEDGNYFIVTINDLDPNATYPLQFRWKYKDGTFAKDWSAVKVYVTPGESNPNTPSFLASDVDVSEPEKLIITYRGLSDDATPVPITDIDRVDVYISGAPFDGTKPAYSFKEAGTQIIPAPAGTYIIVLYAISKLGTKSPVSSPVTKTVTAAIVPIDPPTLPSGLSVASAPFAVSVNWNGTYSSGGFDGFKSIDIHVRGSDVGATATSGFSTTTQVATLTVDSTTNRQNVGLDNLRQALSLANNTAAYTAPMFFYYIARNQNDELYSVGGTPTYTRINSTTVNPTQANFVDLANGVISIENLVAGNGQFSSWLRTGSAGGTRIELSGVNDFSNSGYTVQKGLVAYSSGNTEIFNLDLDAGSLTINGSGTFTGNLAIGSGNSVFKAEPAKAIWLGNSTWNNSGDAPFSVSVSGSMYARSGTIGGWTLGTTFLQGNNIKLDTNQIIVGSTSQPYFDISPSSLTHRNANGTASGKFTLTLGASSQLTIDGTLTVNGSSVATSSELSGYATDSELTTGLSGKISTGGAASDVNSNVTTISGGKIRTGQISSTGYSYTSGNFSNVGMEINLDNGVIRSKNFGIDSSGNAFFNGDVSGSTGTFAGKVSGGDIDISTDSFSDRIKTSYLRSGPVDSTQISSLAINAVAHVSTSTSGWVTSTYPYWNGGADLGISNFRWRRLLIDNGGYGTAAGSYIDLGEETTRLYSDGRIYANTLGTATTSNFITQASGFLRVNTSSSRRYKTDIVDIDSVEVLDPENLLNIPVRAFKYNAEHLSESDQRFGVLMPGFIAEEVDLVYPLAVDYNDEGLPERWNTNMIVPGMLALIQKQHRQIEILSSRLDALEG